MRLLVVDDEPTLRSVLAQTLEEDGHEVVTAADGDAALVEFQCRPFPMVMTDIMMPGSIDGIELLRRIREIDPGCLVVVMTSNTTLESAVDALRCGAYDYLPKPFDELDLISAVVRRGEREILLVEENRSLIANLERKAEELQFLNAELQNMADHDPLTGLYNRRYFHKALKLELERSRRHDRRFTLIMVDVDSFKNFNDSMGHPAGDELLKQLSERLTELSRLTTVVARYGGEEFVLLIPEADRTAAKMVAEQVREGVDSFKFPHEDAQPGGSLTLSLGVACFPDDGDDAGTLIDRADQALYQAKNGGRNRFVLWSELSEPILDPLDLQNQSPAEVQGRGDCS